MLAGLHLGLMVVHFVWNALTTYAATEQGQAELNDIEAVLTEVEDKTPGTSPVESVVNSTLEAARAQRRASK